MNPTDIINQTNQYRKEAGLPLLSTNPLLMKAATNRASDMVKTGSFSHSVATTTPGADNWSFIKNAGYPYSAAGENLAVNFNSATDTMDAWKNSASHNANLTSKRYSDIGVAIVPGVYKGKKTYFVVQYFGRPGTVTKKTTPITPSQTNTAPKQQFGFTYQPRTLDFSIANSTPQRL